MKLADKVVIVTGGSRGIGKEIVQTFLHEGARVVIAARNKKAINDVLKTADQNKVIGIPTDVSKSAQINHLVQETLKTYGTIDILVNSAGIQQPIGPLIDNDPQEWIENISTNLIGTMLCCKSILPVMIEKRKGKIVNFSGGGAASPRPYFSAYASAKAAVVRFTETVAFEVKRYNIDINAIAPGAVNTRMLQEIIEAGKEKAGEKEFADAMKRLKDGGTPPARAAELAVWLSSPQSDGFTGKIVSAVWDPWQSFRAHIEEFAKPNLYTLRRIDNKYFFEKGK